MGHISLKNVFAKYNGVDCFKDISLEINKGEFIGVLNAPDFISLLAKEKNVETTSGDLLVEGDLSKIELPINLNRKGKEFRKLSKTVVKKFLFQDAKKKCPKKVLLANAATYMKAFDIDYYFNKKFIFLDASQILKAYFVKSLLEGSEIVLVKEVPDYLASQKRPYLEPAFNLMKNDFGTSLVICFKDASQALRLCDKVAIFKQDNGLELMAFDTPENVLKSSDDFVKDYLKQNYADQIGE